MTIPVPLRPRERLADAGASSLKDSELVALLLGTGDTQRPAVRIAEELLGAFASAQDPSGLTGLLIAWVATSTACALLALPVVIRAIRRSPMPTDSSEIAGHPGPD